MPHRTPLLDLLDDYHDRHVAVCERDTINFFLERSTELDKVLQIFIRINQGGTQLSYSDLLLSIATAQWKTLDARKEIHEFVDKINDIGKGFNFNKDFVLKSCLVLTDMKNVGFKVDNFSAENMAVIESQWELISDSVSLAIRLAAHFGFADRTLTSANAVIPIAYFLKTKDISESILHAENQKANRGSIKQWLIRVLLKRQFGGTADALYPAYRQVIQESGTTFPLQELVDRYSGTNKSLDFHEEDIDNLLYVKYGSPFAFMLLSVLYPPLMDYEFHQDHIHPRKKFTPKRLEAAGIQPESTRDEYAEKRDMLPNLQLLQATPNLEKSGKPLEEWLPAHCKTDTELAQYKATHLFPTDADLSFDNFLEFFEQRQALVRERLLSILDVKGST